MLFLNSGVMLRKKKLLAFACDRPNERYALLERTNFVFFNGRNSYTVGSIFRVKESLSDLQKKISLDRALLWVVLDRISPRNSTSNRMDRSLTLPRLFPIAKIYCLQSVP